MTKENKNTTKRSFGKIGNYVVNFSPPAGTPTALVGFQYQTIANEEKDYPFQEEKQSELEEKITKTKKDDEELVKLFEKQRLGLNRLQKKQAKDLEIKNKQFQLRVTKLNQLLTETNSNLNNYQAQLQQLQNENEQ